AVVGAQELSPRARPAAGLDRAGLRRGQQSRPDRPRELHDQRRRPPHADQEGAAAARSAIFHGLEIARRSVKLGAWFDRQPRRAASGYCASAMLGGPNRVAALRKCSMLKLDGQKLDDGRWFTGTVERNKDPILNLLKRVLPHTGLILEIG